MIDLDLLKSSSVNKQIYLVDKELNTYLKKTILTIAKNFKGIPETVEGFYWEFMFEVPSHIKEFEGNEKDFHIYLAQKCRFVVSNKCKQLNAKPHRVMNNYIHLENDEQAKTPEITFELSDNQESSEVLFKNLNQSELAVFQKHFVENKTINQVANELNITRYKVEQLIISASAKLNKKNM